jgi:hypothetical protein
MVVILVFRVTRIVLVTLGSTVVFGRSRGAMLQSLRVLWDVAGSLHRQDSVTNMSWQDREREILFLSSSGGGAAEFLLSSLRF